MEITKKQFEQIRSTPDLERLDKLFNYYTGEQAINNRIKDADLKNNKIVINNASYITDINVGYVVGNPIQYQTNQDNQEVLDVIIDEYDKQSINKLDTKLAKNISIYGIGYEYIYAKPNVETGIDIKSTLIPPTNAYLKRDGTVENNVLWGCFWSKQVETINGNEKEYLDITVVDDKEVITYTLKNGNLIKDEERCHPHFFGKVPLIKYKNNEEAMGDFEKVISIIDALNLLQSDRVNDKEQLVNAILTIYGAELYDDDVQALKENRVMHLPDNAKAEYLIKALNEGEIETLKRSLEQDLHKISLTPNMSDENFAQNSSGVALGYKLLPFEQSAKNKANYMEDGLELRLECYANLLKFLNRIPFVITAKDVDVIFVHNLPVNNLENAQIVSMLSGLVDQKTLLSTLPFVKDVEGSLQALQEEKSNNMNMFSINTEGLDEYGQDEQTDNRLHPEDKQE